MARVFVDSSVLVRYFIEDDIPRAIAAGDMIESDHTLVISTSVLLEVVHAVRQERATANPELAEGLIAFLSRSNVLLLDADQATTIAGLQWSLRVSARRIPDAIIAAAADQSACDYIATFDEAFSSPTVPVRLI